MGDYMQGEFHWPIILMIVILILAFVGIVFLVNYFIRRVEIDTSTLLPPVKTCDPLPTSPVNNAERDTFVVIPDISGYTRFMHLTRFAAGHAQFVIAQLLDAIITSAAPLSPTRVGGDSVMLYAVSNQDNPATGASGDDVATAIQNIVTAFYRKRDALLSGNLCPCEACQYIPGLDLKVVVHRGKIQHYHLRGLQDLSGMAVIEAHRLLKNSVNSNRYVLVSAAAAEDVHPDWQLEAAPHREYYDGIGEVCCNLYLLEEAIHPPTDMVKSPIRDMAGKLARNLETIIGASH